ncbi:hypothetical protein N1851_027122 [Merluccius polli]|uniref:Uncharacterized protein n=1 Tax=Merluccius polli TaxID=89951 RepID=A0AA47NSG0_MERPO|nr:hypothetical protein N1851_027122 [Merluccius polli]
MAQVWKVVEFRDKSTAIVPSSWLEEAGESWNCFCPPSSYDYFRLQKAVAHHLPPGAAWDVHSDVRVLVSCATYVKAKDYLKKSLQCLTSDKSEAEDPTRRKKRPNSHYRQLPAGRVQTTRGHRRNTFLKVWTLMMRHPPPPPPRKTARPSVDVGPALSNGSQTPELLNIDSPQAGHILQGKSSKCFLKWRRSEVRALRRELVRPVAPEASPSSIKLPLSTMEEFKLAEAVMRETPCEKQKMVGALLSIRLEPYLASPSLFTYSFLSKAVVMLEHLWGIIKQKVE